MRRDAPRGITSFKRHKSNRELFSGLYLRECPKKASEPRAARKGTSLSALRSLKDRFRSPGSKRYDSTAQQRFPCRQNVRSAID